MPQVVMQPSFGKEGRKNWKRTVEAEVDFAAPKYAGALSRPETARLESLHPDGRARFWGSAENHDRDYAKLTAGGVVLFTGDSYAQYIGRVGVILRNSKFGDLLWEPDAVSGSWLNIYTVEELEEIWIPYAEIRALEGISDRYPFRGMDVLDSEKSRIVLKFLRDRAGDAVRPPPAKEEDRQIAGLGKVIPAEALKKARTSYYRRSGLVEVERKETQLVIAYRATLADDQQTTLRTPTGLADFYHTGPRGPELIEAKSSAHMSYVRLALGQLLHYVRSAPEPPARIAALFPKRPSDEGVNFLLDYGIDCIYLGAAGKFVCLEASVKRQDLWRQPVTR
jgi:hypothetical protein